jgi:hypothetical protein
MPLKTIENMSTETINLLKEVIKKKEKKDRYERLRNTCMTSALVLLILFMGFLYVTDFIAVSDPFSTFANIILNPYYLGIIVTVSALIVYFNYYQKKLKKEKEKLNKVRAEVIDHLNDSKNMNLQDIVEAIKEEMKKEYNINLYVKNK